MQVVGNVWDVGGGGVHMNACVHSAYHVCSTVVVIYAHPTNHPSSSSLLSSPCTRILIIPRTGTLEGYDKAVLIDADIIAW